MKKLLALALALVLIGCMAGAALAEGKVGVLMPTQSLQRWNQDGANMKEKLEAAGYEVDLQYANNDIPTQVAQVENEILNDVNVLVIAAVDSWSLTTVLADAKAAGIPVIAYDRNIMETDAVTYYATFDNYQVGQIQGQYLETQLDLANRTADNSVNIEFFGGDPGDPNAQHFFNGAWDVLSPYIESGVVKVPSGQTEFAQIATANWDSANSQSRMDNLIAANYSDGTKLDAVCCSNDSTALGVTNALIGAGFDEFPLITGQDCDVANTKNIILGFQSMSVFKDTRTLAEKVVAMVDTILKGEEPEINDTTTYDNGVFVVPTYVCAPVFADKNNYKELLVDSGYYTEADLEVAN
ncbi:sugar ABC transporter substrate-binding protein [Clostridia bacterium]|nr:sugar ABC transporter substrate-binding protein [Clostridia bacterium]